jgi:hypothetical protein
MSKASKALTPVLSAFERAKRLIEAEKAAKQVAVLSQAEREANLAKHLEGSQFPRGYHGTTSLDEHSYEPAAITRFNDYKPVWASKNPSLAEEYLGHDSGATYPLHISAKNPLKLDVDMNAQVGSSLEMQKMFDSFGIEYDKKDPIYRHVNTSQFRDAAEGRGYDSIIANERGEPTVGVFSSTQMKSATGNRGTYDPNLEDIGHAQGGMVDSAPEEAIKNTITDPQAFRMLDMDLANLALMNQPQRMAGGGIARMAGGGLRRFVRPAADAIMDMGKVRAAGRAAHQEQAATRAAKDAEVADQMANLPPRNKQANEELGLYHPIGGGIKLSRPPSGMHSTTVADPAFNPPDIGIITPEQLVKEQAALFPLVGDRAAGGRYLTHVGENEFETPVRLTAGPLYMDANYNHLNPDNSAAWESGVSRVTALGKQAQRAGQGGRPVYGIYTAGSGTNTDFNVMGANALMQQIPFSKITKKAEKEFNLAMLNGTNEYPPIPEWPGIRSPQALEMLLDKSNGIARTKLFGIMGKENFQAMGFPDVPATRKAIIEPELLDVPTNQAGFRLARMDATGRIIEDPIIPSDYPKAMAGKVAGKLDVPADYKDIFQSHFDARRLLSQPVSGDYYSFSRAHPIQYADDDWLNRLMEQRRALERKIKLGEYAEGGAVHMAEGGQVQRFDEGGEVSQSELDRMKFEIAQQQNPSSPVMQATPRGAIQDFIGTAGGYMDKAGKFVSEAIAPTAEKHPVKHFLANMLLADSLKSAGTALQDYTGTAREADEDNPVRGIIDKDWRKLSTGTAPLLDPRALDIAGFATPVIKGVTKLAGAGAKAITPFAKSKAEMAAELYGRGQMPGMVAPNAYMAEPSAPKPAKALAPANEQGFYSPTEAAALNLQRKSGNGQAFLNDLMKGDNVKAEEISAMGLDTFLKDKKNVTAAEVQDYIAQNKLGLGEARYDDSITENAMGIPEHKETKFKQYSLPGGENYREVVLTLPDPKDALMDQIKALGITKSADRISINDILQRGGSDELAESWKKAMTDPYRSSHFDEPNVLAHLRMSDRVTDGKKTLLVDEVQSDWHQAGREKGYGPTMEKSVEAYYETKDGQRIPIGFGKTKEEAEANIDVGWKNMVDIKYETHERKVKEGVPDAPYKEDWYQLALRRAVKEAIDGGYDRVALPTGARVNERFSLTKQINEIHYSGSNLKAYDHNGNEVISQTGVRPEDLPSYVGKETANKLLEQPKQGTLRSLVGQDLEVGGEGNKEWYDKIYPGYLKKFGKKYGAEVGKTTVDVRGKDEPLHYMDITPAMRKEFSTGIHMKRGGKVSFAQNIDAMRRELTKAK